MVSAEASLAATVGGGLILSTLALAGSTVLQVRQHDSALFGAGDDDGLAGRVDENGDRIEHHDRVLFREGMMDTDAVRTDGGESKSDRNSEPVPEGGRC